MHVRNWMRAAVMGAVLGSAVSLAKGPSKGDPAAGKTVYERDCKSCHGATGKGDGEDAAYFNTKRTDLTDKPATKLSDAELLSVIAYIRQLSGTKSGK